MANPVVPADDPPTTTTPTCTTEPGKFLELHDAEMGKVALRLCLEAATTRGRLHLGHAKAALLNQYYADKYEGKLSVRFDDTDSTTENVDYEQGVLQDLKTLGIEPTSVTHTSDYFGLAMEHCEKLLQLGKAYVDDTSEEDIARQQRDWKPSSSRDNSVERNLTFWKEMLHATELGRHFCVRAKIDFTSQNDCMRDPTIYKYKDEPHPRTVHKYRVYPTDDFVCPIADAHEGITHVLRTTDYKDQNELYKWFVRALDLQKPRIREFSRLYLTNTILSKHELAWLVNEGLVDGWDDPRMPTIRGILRRGLTVEALKQFILGQGSSKAMVCLEWEKLWALNRKLVYTKAVRYTALNAADLVPVRVNNVAPSFIVVADNHWDPNSGTKRMQIGPTLLIERQDAEQLCEKENAHFVHFSNLLIRKIIRDEIGEISEIFASLNLDDKEHKELFKLTWIGQDWEKTTEPSVPCRAVYYEHVITKPVLYSDEDYRDFLARDTMRQVEMIGEMELKRVTKGEIIELQRKGFFRCEVPHKPGQPMVLIHIPDGRSQKKK